MSIDSKITIITVVKNQKDALKKTIESILNQSYKNIEYIIIDGASIDGTIDVIESYIHESSEFNKKTRHKISHFESKKDDGLYFAMNKGVQYANGEFINFMNAGDYFYDEYVIEKIFKNQNYNDVAVIYGNTQIMYDDKNSKILGIKNHNHKYHHNFIHQSSFVKTSIMKKYEFDTDFRIAADSKFFTTIFNTKDENNEKMYKFLYKDMIIAIFDASGISSTLSFKMFKEDLKIGQTYNRFFFISFFCKYIFSLIPRFLAKKMLEKLGLKNLLNKARKNLSQKNL